MELKEMTPLKEILPNPKLLSLPSQSDHQQHQNPPACKNDYNEPNQEEPPFEIDESQIAEIQENEFGTIIITSKPFKNAEGKTVSNSIVKWKNGRVDYWKERKSPTEEEKELERQKKEAEENQKREKRIQDLIKSARVPYIFKNARAADFITTDNNKETVDLAINSILDNTGLYIYGECGTGKTMLTSIIVNERAHRNKSSTFICATDIFFELNPFMNEDSTIAKTKRSLIKKTPCLIIDDLGAEKTTEWTNSTLFDIVNYRYNQNLQTIFTSNFTLKDIEDRINGYEGERLIRRIKAICKITKLNPY